MDKLIRSVNALKFHYGGLIAEEKNQKDIAFTPKEKQFHLNVIAESLTSPSLKGNADLPGLLTISIEILLQSCADESADVRINADGSLNKIIKCLHETSIGKILVELYKDIKKNGHPRSVRASLSRFSILCSNIRPNKCRAYILNLLPCLCRISQREEDSLQECLATSTCKIFSVLGVFASEAEVQGLVASFLKNLSSKSLSVRRAAGTCLHAIIANSRKQEPVLLPMLHSILDILVQRHADRSTVLGCMQTLRLVVPLLHTEVQPTTNKHQEMLMKIFESSLYYLCHQDHTVVTAALELLEQLLKTFPLQLARALSSLLPSQTFTPANPGAVADDESLISIATTSSATSLSNMGTEDENLLGAQADGGTQANGMDVANETTNLIDSTPQAFVTNHAETISENGSSDNTLNLESNKSQSDHGENGNSSSVLHFTDFYVDVGVSSGNYSVNDPLHLLGLLLSQRFLLESKNGQVLHNKKVRVSMKNLALNCLAHLVNIAPNILCLQLYPTTALASDVNGDASDRPSLVRDVFSYCKHDDPQLRGAVLSVGSSFICSTILKHKGGLEEWIETESQRCDFVTAESVPDVEDLGHMMMAALGDESSGTARQACSAISACMPTLLNSVHFKLGLEMAKGVFALQHNTYWLIQTDMLEFIASLNFRQLAHVEAVLCEKMPTSLLVKTRNIQDEALAIVLRCLQSDDLRIRKVATEAAVAMVPSLALATDNVSSETFSLCREQLGVLYMGGKISDEPGPGTEPGSVKSMLRTYRGFEGGRAVEGVTNNLALMIQRISSILSTTTVKHSAFGCVSALKLLSTKFPVYQYPEAWGCHFTKSLDHDVRLRAGSNLSSPGDASTHGSAVQLQQLGILPVVMDLLKTSWLPLDLTAHIDCLLLAGNLLAGAASHEYSVLGEPGSESATPSDGRRTLSVSFSTSHNVSWSSIQDVKLSSYAQTLFVHLVKLLSVNHHVITETTPSSNKSVLPNLPSNPSLPSPIKRKDKSAKEQSQTGGGQSKNSPKPARKILPSSPLVNDANKSTPDGDKDKNARKTLGTFHQNRVLMRLYDQLNGAYKNYKSSLEFGNGDRMSSFVRTVLDVTCQILELASFIDVANYTEEMLGYIKSSFTLQPNLSVLCTQQLLKALFGTNLVSQRGSTDDNPTGSRSSLVSPRNNSNPSDFKTSFYHQVFHHPLNHLTMSIANASFHNSLNTESAAKDGEGWFGSIKKKMEIKLTRASKLAKSNKSSIQNYIRLFEGLVIRSLTKYTVTSSVDFQKEVLCLLTQLVQLRVNYCMLDSDLVFISFIIKQFESIEAAMIRDSEGLVPHVFFFLVLLSYECYQSKSIITMPKIIQLCDGLMASGLGAISHVIPALQPIVHDLFVVKSQSRQDVKEMTTQREVVQFTMIKLIQHPQILKEQVFGMLTSVLQHGRRENVKSWKELSRQVVNVLLSHLNNLQIDVNSQEDLTSLHTLFEAVSPTSLRPCDTIVEYLFAVPDNTEKTSNMKRWLGKVVVLLRLLICHVNEEDLMVGVRGLMLLSHSSASPSESESLTQAEEVFVAKFFHRLLSTAGEHLHRSSTSSIHTEQDSNVFVCQEIAELFLNLTYVHRSGSFKRFTAACRNLATDVDFVTSERSLHVTFADLSTDFPVLALLWCQYLTHLDAVDLDSWNRYIGSVESTRDKVISRSSVRRGALILLADYVCQNIQQTQLMTWLIDNHVYDVIELGREPPVQDLLSSVQKSEQATNFVNALARIPASKLKPVVLRNILRSLSGTNLASVENLLDLLLGDSFLFSPLLALAQSCDRMACECVEKVLARGNGDEKLMNLEAVDRLLGRLTLDEHRRKRFARLYSLLIKSRDQVTGETTSQPQTSPTVPTLLTDPDKAWFKRFLLGCCERDAWTPECARALSNCDYDDIAEVMRNEHFKVSYLEPCISLGVSETLHLSSGAAPYPEDQSSVIMKCASDVMAGHVRETAQSLASLPDFPQELDEGHLEWKWTYRVFAICRNFNLQLKYDQDLKADCRVDTTLYSSCVSIALHATEILYWQLRHGDAPALCDVITCAESLQQLMKLEEVRNSIVDDAKAVACVVQTFFDVVQHYVGELPLHKPFLPSEDRPQSDKLLDVGNPLAACVRLSQLVDFFRASSDAYAAAAGAPLPGDLSRPIRNLVLHLATSPIANSYVRAPRLLWKFGWRPDVSGPHGTVFPDVPTEYLQEKDVLIDFVGIVNTIGWTNRTQYEETWASLLGVLVSQPVVVESESESQNEDAIELSCIAIRALTSLVINCSLLPHSGHPSTGTFEVHHRHAPLKLAHTRPGRQLLRVRAILNEEIDALLVEKDHMHTHHHYHLKKEDPTYADWLTPNMERVMTSNTKYGLGQVSVRAFQNHYGIQPVLDDVTSLASSDDESSAVTSSGPDHSVLDGDSDASDVFEQESRAEASPALSPTVALSPLRVRDGVDVHSCVQFLLDLFTEWFRTSAQANQVAPGSAQAPPSPVARPILCESARSLLLISNLFTERQQFEWMYSALLQLHSVQPPEDEILLQYTVTSICKAGAVLGLSADVSDAVLRALEPCFNCASVSWHIAALQGALYCLERSPNANLKPIVDLLAEFIPSKLVNATTSKSIYNEEYVIMLASTAYYVIEKCADVVAPEFTSVIVQASTLLLSSSDGASSTPSRVFHAVTHGLERLVLVFALSSVECDAVLKAAADQLQNNVVLARSSAACALMLTCMYCERMRTASPDAGAVTSQQEDAVETRLLAMERVSLLFERIRRGFARDARVMTRILPLLLDDFFPPQDVMNKVIAEFISTFQPFPDLIAHVVNQVFQALHNRDRSQLVQEWVMLSLGNVIQRTPLSTAVWCLTCLFACASTNPWINSLLSVISERRNKADPERDWDFFCKTAIDFYRFQLSEELDRRSFHATFSTAASSHRGESPYRLLLDCIGALGGESGILQ